MEKTSFGLTSWDTVELNQPTQFKKTKDLYLKLENGKNRIRCVTRPYQYSVHTYKEEGDTGYGDKIKCSKHHGSCAVCEENNRPKLRWYVGVIDRKTQSFKILDIGASVFKTIQEMSRDEAWGDPGKYDLTIIVNKSAAPAQYYTVMGVPPTPLSDADIKIKESVDTEELIRLVTPPTPEKTMERLAACRARKNGKKAPATSNDSVSNDSVATEAGGDEDFSFPSVQ